MTYNLTICILKTSDGAVSVKYSEYVKIDLFASKTGPSLATRRVMFERIMA